MHRSWPELVEFYTDLVEAHGYGPACSALADLCQKIGDSNLELYGHTSLATLGVSRQAVTYPPAEGHRILRLTPDGEEIVFQLKVFCVADPDPWTRRASICKLPERFDTYLKQVL